MCDKRLEVTRPEPVDLCQKPSCFPTEILQEFLFCLAKTNQDLIKNYNRFSGFFKRKPITVFVFNMCDKLNITIESRFLAVELFDKFMCVHLKEIQDAVLRAPTKNWAPNLEKIKSQMLLRALTCIQLANKIYSNDSIIKCSRVKQILSDMGFNYSLESILNSELRVLKYLEYKVNLATPFTFMEILLEILGKNAPDLEPKFFYLIGCKVLECFYCMRDEIYSRLYESITGRTRDLINDREAFGSIENNYLYLSSSIIVASAHIYNHSDKDMYNAVLNAISLITKLEKSDIDEFAVILCHFVLLNE